jgi:hypothetical protein
MIRLNTKDGRFEVDKFFIYPGFTLKELTVLSKLVDIEKIIENGSHLSFGIKGVDDYCIAIALYFFEETIERVVIFLGERYSFPPFIVTAAEREEIERLIKKLGGARRYDWGSVEISEDTKAGSISILVRYNRSFSS